MLTGVASTANANQGLGAGSAIGIGVVVLVLGLLLGLAHKYGRRGQSSAERLTPRGVIKANFTLFRLADPQVRTAVRYSNRCVLRPS